MKQLDMQKNVLITGSTSGIGLAMAKLLASMSYNIMIHGKVNEFADGDKLCAQLSELCPGRSSIIEFGDADMRDKSQIRKLIDKCEDAFGGVDILINNAGIQHVAPIENFPDEKWDEIMYINLSAYFYTIKRCLPGMQERKYGRIINTASTHGIVASPEKSAYVASKHGVIGLTKVVALETAQLNITCNAICPGFVMTPLVKKQVEDLAMSRELDFSEAEQQFCSGKHPSGRFVQEEELANMVLTMINTPSMTGASVVIDGGWTAI